MKRKIALIMSVLLSLGIFASCKTQDKTFNLNVPVSHITELGGVVEFAPLSQKAENVIRYDINVTDPFGTDVAFEGKSFIPTQVGNYLITYTAHGENGIVDQKSTLVTVLPALAPDITVKQDVNNIVWQYGKTYRIPSAMVLDNLDTELGYQVEVKDSLGQVAAVKDGKITPVIGGFYTLTYSSYDEAGNKGEKVEKIYCTAEQEISSFETPQLLTMFSASDDGGDKNVTWEMSYNTDKRYTYGNSEGSLKMHYEETAENSWPGVVLMGDSMAKSNLFESDMDGIRFKMYLTGNVTAKQDVFLFIYSKADPAAEGFVEARFNLRTYLDGFGLNQWLDVALDKDELATIVQNNTGATFDGQSIYRLKIWTLVNGEGKYLDMYLDDFEYFKN